MNVQFAKQNSRFSSILGLAILAIATVASIGRFLSNAPAQEPGRPQTTNSRMAVDQASIDRTREQVKMLDDIYKGGIVLITTHYVDDKSDLAAGSAFQKLFAIAKEKGWHEVRLLDATGDPYESNNLPRQGFEKESVTRLLKGEAFVERIVEEDGQPFFFASTPIPVVMDKCVMCHENYAGVPAGRPIGALSYKLPLVK